MKANAGFWVGCALISIVLSGCNRYQVIPDHLVKQVNEKLSYEQVKDSPETYRGQIVVWGGEVVSAVREDNRTKIEVLQMPLNKDQVPESSKASSQGRFLALDSRQEIIDPAIFEKGSKVTVIGEIEGKSSKSSDLVSSESPVLVIRDMTLWSNDSMLYPVRPYYGYGGYYGYRPYVFWEGTRVSGS